jgi:Mannosylglycerate hydrolase MGH1-like glycoside hydrolase domain
MNGVNPGQLDRVPPTHPPSPAGTDRPLWREATRVLDNNWSSDHTMPSHLLYPHQWSWDSAFISIGLARCAPARAWRELRSLFQAQWADGRVPHIVFDPHVAETDYFPGPAFWRAPQPPRAPDRCTTGVVQPPVHAIAAWEVYRITAEGGAAQPAREELGWLYPLLVAQQHYLAGRRDVGRAGLASLVHPWESGLDNSPSWDTALSAVPVDRELLHRHHRRDIDVAVAAHRPTDDDYARFIAIAAAYRDRGYRDDDLAATHPFLVECPAFNAIYAAAEAALARIAEVIGVDPVPHRERAAQITRALVERLYNPDTGTFHALDLRSGKLSPAHCANGLIPLILPDLPPAQVAGVLAEAGSRRFGLARQMALPLPSYDRTATDFDRLRYWRGPIWININWLLWRGLRAHREDAAAAALRAAMLRLVGEAGCYEYFDPVTGAGIGSPAFSWTAALTLDLLAEGSPG